MRLAFVDDEPLGAGVVREARAGAAAPRRGARHRKDLGAARTEGGEAGNLLRGAPRPLRFTHHEPVRTEGAVSVRSPGAAAALPGARYRNDLGEPAPVEGGEAGNFLRRTPHALRLTSHEA